MTGASDDGCLSQLRAIYVREYQGLRSHLKFALGGNTCLAEDLTHEVFLELWRLHGDALAGMSHTHVRAKLVMTANSRVIDFYRRSSREITVPDPAHETVQAAARAPVAPDPSERVLAVDALDRFWRVLRDDLTNREFQAAYLSWAVGMSGTEVAAALGTTRTVAYQLRDAARKKIEMLVNRDPHHIIFKDDGDLAASVSSMGAHTGGHKS
ncbi:RNA polymerase sigma factor [Nocardia fusca]|uniref:RNA polymerase sigma factor n=1 Tax=Nocardia fusca TaxID=941183 RepID=UPI000AD3FF06|nr:hypothetical protein [Nocardia fusca]